MRRKLLNEVRLHSIRRPALYISVNSVAPWLVHLHTPDALLHPGAPSGNGPETNFWSLAQGASRLLNTLPPHFSCSRLHSLPSPRAVPHRSLVSPIPVRYLTIRLTHARPSIMDA
jgi:hypothetical protein